MNFVGVQIWKNYAEQIQTQKDKCQLDGKKDGWDGRTEDVVEQIIINFKDGLNLSFYRLCVCVCVCLFLCVYFSYRRVQLKLPRIGDFANPRSIVLPSKNLSDRYEMFPLEILVISIQENPTIDTPLPLLLVLCHNLMLKPYC